MQNKNIYRNIMDRAVEKAMENNYTFSFNGDVKDLKYRTRFTVVCDECGHTWETNVENLICNNSGCKKCKGKLKHDEAEMNKRILEIAEKQNLQLINFEGYKSQTSYIEYICKDCGTKERTTTQLFLSKETVCNICSGRKVEEYDIRDYFISKGYKVEKNVKIINNPDNTNKRKLEVDIYLPDVKIAIEYNENNGHKYMAQRSSKLRNYFNTIEEYHNYKVEECLKDGIRLFHIFEDDYKENQLSILKNILEVIKNK